MEERIRELLNSAVSDDYYLALNLITEDTIKEMNSHKLYKMIVAKGVSVELNMSEILRLKRIFNSIDYPFQIIDFI